MIKKIETNSGFRIILQCDHIIGYMCKCENCGTIIDTENQVKIKKCYKCGSKKTSGIKAMQCHNKYRIEFSRIDANGKKVKISDNAMIKNELEIDMDKTAEKKWYCLKHRGMHG